MTALSTNNFKQLTTVLSTTEAYHLSDKLLLQS